MNLALLVLRLVVGVTFVAHGSQKLLGAFGGHGMDATAHSFEQIGLRPGRPNAWVAALAEVVGGLLIALGLVTTVAAAAVMGVMFVAALKIHLPHGFFATDGGYEFPLVMTAAAFSLAGVGAGAWSLDDAFGIDMAGTGWAIGALAVGVLGGLGVIAAGRLMSRRAAAAGPGQPHPA